MSDNKVSRRTRTPATGPRARDQILAATVSLVRDVGYAGLSVEAIAERSGVSKVTIYRWWPHKAAVTMDALLESQDLAGFSDTGSVKHAFHVHLDRVGHFFNGTGGTLLCLIIAEVQRDPELRESFFQRFWQVRRQAARDVLERGIASGELKTGIDVDDVLDRLYGPLYLRRLIGHAPINKSLCYDLVEEVFGGIER
ncbi:TetR/AcrR family transcriptional regulator [Arthrobacter sp. KNU40]|uniref:TetR/AcrR family transcriptional regulator n=1 Tax=Arthrobacter sp. KNU40 TaxID=3447965 RepID=UPI003F5EB252